jgi:arylsulfatase A-like enzyme
VHLELRRIAGQEQPRQPQVVFSLQVPEESRRWGDSVEAPARLPGEGQTEVRVWKGGGQLYVPDPPDLSGVNQVWVHGRFDGFHTVRLRLGEGEEAIVGESIVESDSRSTPLRLDLPGDPGKRDRDWSSLDLLVQGPDCEIEKLELVAEPPEYALPDPESPGLVGMEGLFLRGVGLAQDRGLEASFSVEPGDVLQFALGVPENVRGDLAGSAVRVTIDAPPHSVQHTYRLAKIARGDRRWVAKTLPLESFEGLEARVRFELEDLASRPVAAVLAGARAGHRGRRSRTVLLITSDTHRADHLGVAGAGVDLQTPALDGLAVRGVLFEDCQSPSHITGPSHASILTGLSPRDTGLVSNTQRLAGAARTLAEVFRHEGYLSLAIVSSFHLGPRGVDLARDFDRLSTPVERGWSAEESVDLMLEWLDEVDGLPTFAWLHLFDAHQPYLPPGEFDRLYYPESKDPYDPRLPELDLPVDEHQIGLEGVRDLEFPRAQYRAEVSYLDRQLGRLLEDPRMGDAVIAFTSDHGEALFHPDGIFDHLKLVPGTLHVPLVLTWPGAPAGRRVTAPVDQIDLGRTLLDLAGLRGVEFPGKSLLRNLEQSSWRDAPRFALGDHARHASVTAGKWFLVLHLRDAKPRGFEFEKHRVELYDTEEDPGCLTDLAKERHEAARDLRTLLIEWLSTPPALLSASNGELDEEQMAQLRALGYVGDDEEASSTLFDPDCACERCAEFR